MQHVFAVRIHQYSHAHQVTLYAAFEFVIYPEVVIDGGLTPVKIFFRLRLQNLSPGVCPPMVADGRWLAVVLWCACLRVEGMVSIVLCMSKGGGHGFNVGALL